MSKCDRYIPLFVGTIVWGVVAGYALNAFEDSQFSWFGASFLGIMSTGLFTYGAIRILKIPTPVAWWLNFFFPIIGAVLSVAGRMVGARFYGW